MPKANKRCGCFPVVAMIIALVCIACTTRDESSNITRDGDNAIIRDQPVVLVTTGIWADVVSNVVCDGSAQIRTLIPGGGDPHSYEPSLHDREHMENAALVVSNGLGLEASLQDTLDVIYQSGTPVFEFAADMDTISYSFDHTDEHDNSGHDPHVWFDPQRVAKALPSLASQLSLNPHLDDAVIDSCLVRYLKKLHALDAEIVALVETLPLEKRKLVTNHDALGYFADRYGFEVLGTVIPASSNMGQTNPAQLGKLAEIIEQENINAIFAELSHTTDVAEVLAKRVGDIEVVALHTGSLGPSGSGADTYLKFIHHNANLIVKAIGRDSQT